MSKINELELELEQHKGQIPIDPLGFRISPGFQWQFMDTNPEFYNGSSQFLACTTYVDKPKRTFRYA